MNNNWFEMEHVIRGRQADFLREAAELRRAQTIRAARPAAPGRMTAGAAEARHALPVAGITLAVRIGGALVAIGRRLQGASVLAEDAATCVVCGKQMPVA